QVAPHVQQRETLLADPGLVALGVHLPEHLELGDGMAVLIGQQGCRRRRAAAEVVLLLHGRPEARFLEAGHLDRVAAAVRHAQAERTGMHRSGRGQREHAANGTAECGDSGHGVGSRNCTFSALPFWISTFEPLFWITVVMPLALANAPPSRLFMPLSMWSAWLPFTSPSSWTLDTTTDCPPRSASSACTSSTGPMAGAGRESASCPDARAPPCRHAPVPATRMARTIGLNLEVRQVISMLLPGTGQGGRRPCVQPRGPGCTHGYDNDAPRCRGTPRRAERRLRAAHVEVGLHGDALLDQRRRAAVLRDDHDPGRCVRAAVHCVGHVEAA